MKFAAELLSASVAHLLIPFLNPLTRCYANASMLYLYTGTGLQIAAFLMAYEYPSGHQAQLGAKLFYSVGEMAFLLPLAVTMGAIQAQASIRAHGQGPLLPWKKIRVVAAAEALTLCLHVGLSIALGPAIWNGMIYVVLIFSYGMLWMHSLTMGPAESNVGAAVVAYTLFAAQRGLGTVSAGTIGALTLGK